MAPKSAPKYIGYVGGVAVAAGIGAAIAVAGQGTAHAETDGDTGAKSGAVDAGPVKTDSAATKSSSKPSIKPLAKFGNDVQKAANQANANLTSAVTKVSASFAKPAVAKPSAAKPAPKKLKATAEEFQAKQVAALKKAFTPAEAAVTPSEPTTPTVKNGSASSAKVADAAAPSVSAAAVPGLPDPFGATDPEPYDIPDEVIAIREAIVQQVGPEYAAYAREGVEAAYRVSQMVPWLNVIVPAVTILDVLPPAIAGEKDEAQIIVNELIKTSQIGSILYYGYDQAADLANVESDAQAFKVQLYRSTWDLLDPVGLLHVAGTSGLEAL